ncbi:MAG: rod shape-determining protein MreC [Gammaproteobacteria bacterium]|nr:rod shape-determining protein MreC [Gammaproteobacteria bacterium]
MQGTSIHIKFGLLLLLSVILMTVDHRQRHLEGIRSVISVAISPLRYIVNLPFVAVDWLNESLTFRNNLLNENRALQEKQLLLEVKLQKLAFFEQENRRLRSMLQSAKRDWEKVLIAELIAVDFDPFKRLVQLNKGSGDGVFEGHPILDAKGIVGQVIHVDLFSSTAMLITDPSHAIPVHNNRNGLRAIAMGTGEPNRLEIPHIPNSTDIRIGDLLVTSGLGLRFPPGYPVARISDIKRNPSEAYAQIYAEPIAHLERTQEVLLVWPESSNPKSSDRKKR